MIGAGAEAEVRIATNKVSGKVVADKIIDKSKHSSERVEEMKKEIEFLGICDHPHVIQIFDCYESPSHLHLVLE